MKQKKRRVFIRSTAPALAKQVYFSLCVARRETEPAGFEPTSTESKSVVVPIQLRLYKKGDRVLDEDDAAREYSVSKTERDLHLEGKCPLWSSRTQEHPQCKEFLSFSVSTPRKWNLLQFYLLLFFPPNSFIKLMRQQETSLSLRLTCQRKRLRRNRMQELHLPSISVLYLLCGK